MSPYLESVSKLLSKLLADDLAPFGLHLALQLFLYFIAGRAVYAFVAGIRGLPAGRTVLLDGEIVDTRSRYTAAYIMIGALAWHFLAFVALFAGMRSILWAHAIAYLPFIAAVTWRPSHALAFHKAWALLLLILVFYVFLPVGTPLYHAMAQSWDEFTHWSSRAKQIFVLDRLPNAHDPITGVAPFYGLYATFIAVFSYVLLGQESVGLATCWSFLFGILIVIHLYEYLRAHGVSMILAGPFCTWFLAALSTEQALLTTTMYADIYVLVGGALTCLHGAEIVTRDSRDSSVGHFTSDAVSLRVSSWLTEDMLLLAGGLGMLLFTKNTADITALCAIGYFGGFLLFRLISSRGWRRFASSARLLLLALVPALVIRGVWWCYAVRTYSDAARVELEQSQTPGGKLFDEARQPIVDIGSRMLESLVAQQPYLLLLCALPACWLIDLMLRLASRRGSRDRQSSILSLWMPLMLMAFIAVFHLNYGRSGPDRAFVNTHRYAAASMVPAACYIVFVVHRFFAWAFSTGDSSRMVTTAAADE